MPGLVSGGRTFTFWHNSCLDCGIPSDCATKSAVEGFHTLNPQDQKRIVDSAPHWPQSECDENFSNYDLRVERAKSGQSRCSHGHGLVGACGQIIANGTIRIGFPVVQATAIDQQGEGPTVGAECRFHNLSNPTSGRGQHMNGKICQVVSELGNGCFECDFGGDRPVAVKYEDLEEVKTYTKWRHLSCMDFTNISSVDSLEGYDELTAHKKLMVEKRLGKHPNTRPKQKKRERDWD